MESVISVAKAMLKKVVESPYRLPAEGNKVKISIQYEVDWHSELCCDAFQIGGYSEVLVSGALLLMFVFCRNVRRYCTGTHFT